MKRLFNCILLAILLFLTTIGRSQELTIDLSNKQEYTLNDTMYISITFKNRETESWLYLKPDIENVNFGLMAFVLKHQTNEKEYVYFLEDGGDIDEISLTCENSILLGEQESFTNRIAVLLKEFTPMLSDKGKYNLSLLIDYSVVDFKVDKCQSKNVFKKKLRGEIKNLELK